MNSEVHSISCGTITPSASSQVLTMPDVHIYTATQSDPCRCSTGCCSGHLQGMYLPDVTSSATEDRNSNASLSQQAWQDSRASHGHAQWAGGAVGGDGCFALGQEQAVPKSAGHPPQSGHSRGHGKEGILLSVEASNTAALFSQLAEQLDRSVGNLDLIAAAISIVASIIDDVQRCCYDGHV